MAVQAFMSYSHDSPTHKQWVITLAEALVNMGVDVILDEWSLMAGEDVVAFMWTGIATADKVVLVCSEQYVKKADGQVGGAGYEGLIVGGEILRTIDTKKFIPVVRANETVNKMPGSLGLRKYIDFSDNALYDDKLDELVRAIHGRPAVSRPALGAVPVFSGKAAPDSLSARVVEPSGLTSDGTPVLGDLWFAEHETAARKGLADFPGAMELRFALHEPINESQIELLKAIQSAEIQTFGWPIGIVLDAEEWKPTPVEDGIVAEVAITENDGISGRPSYDYWAIRKNGDFFLLQSLFEDQRREKVMFVDTRVVRVTEALMFCARLYKALGVADDAKVSIEVVHRGLAGRVLSVASSRRHILPAKSASDVGRAQVVVPVSDLGPHLTDYVVQIVEPLLMLFDFRQLNRKVYEGLVTDFANGRIG